MFQTAFNRIRLSGKKMISCFTLSYATDFKSHFLCVIIPSKYTKISNSVI